MEGARLGHSGIEVGRACFDGGHLACRARGSDPVRFATDGTCKAKYDHARENDPQVTECVDNAAAALVTKVTADGVTYLEEPCTLRTIVGAL